MTLGGCAQGDAGARPACATSAAGDTVGGGGCLDNLYQRLYHPGRGTDFGA